MDVLRLRDTDAAEIRELLNRFALELEHVGERAAIPGSYWGDTEAGLIGNRVYVRDDTPIHSILHEASHAVCMTPERRAALERDAGGDDIEESAVCYLQVLLVDELSFMSRERMFEDMDAWGYSFRLGSARRWFEEDADDAREWLLRHGVITPANGGTDARAHHALRSTNRP